MIRKGKSARFHFMESLLSFVSIHWKTVTGQGFIYHWWPAGSGMATMLSWDKK
jgi:hypothetical protein